VRAGRRAVTAALVVLSGCTGGDSPGESPPPAPATTVSTTSTTPATTAATTAPSTTRSAVPGGSVTLTAREVTLPDTRAGGTGLRLVVRAASPRVTVHRLGGAGAVEACPVAGATAPPVPGDCTQLRPDATVELPFRGGVEVRAGGAAARAGEVALVYLPADRNTTLVTPAHPAGACDPAACRAIFSLTPGRAGEFVLDGRAGGGRPRLVLESVAAGGGQGGSNRTLATVEGGGTLSIKATLEAGREAVLLHQDQGPGPVAPVTAEISWP
jgi:hypothetical protein